LKVSAGPILAFAEAMTVLGLPEDQAAMLNQNQIVFFQADSQHGSSGGAVVSESGEVLARMAGGKSSDEGGKLSRLSRGVRSPLWK
jgi:hypothetical protein